MKFKRFITSAFFLKHLALAVIIMFLIILLTMISLRIYTHHGESLKVPDFVGLSLEQAKSLANENNLRFLVIDSIYTSAVPRGCVAEQNPPASFKVKKGRTIYMRINAFHAEKVAIPNVLDVSLIQAKSDLEAYGLKIGQLIYTEHYARNLVLELKYNGRKILAGSNVVKGSKIDLVLGIGENYEPTSVPNLLSLTANEAIQKLNESFLNVGKMDFDESVRTPADTATAKVWRQSPKYSSGSAVSLGTTFDIWLTKGDIEAVRKEFNIDELEQAEDSTDQDFE